MIAVGGVVWDDGYDYRKVLPQKNQVVFLVLALNRVKSLNSCGYGGQYVFGGYGSCEIPSGTEEDCGRAP